MPAELVRSLVALFFCELMRTTSRTFTRRPYPQAVARRARLPWQTGWAIDVAALLPRRDARTAVAFALFARSQQRAC